MKSPNAPSPRHNRPRNSSRWSPNDMRVLANKSSERLVRSPSWNRNVDCVAMIEPP